MLLYDPQSCSGCGAATVVLSAGHGWALLGAKGGKMFLSSSGQECSWHMETSVRCVQQE